EVDVGRSRLGTSYHLVGIGLGKMIDLPRGVDARHALAASAAVEALRLAGAVVLIAPPYWSGLVGDHLLGVDGVVGVHDLNANAEVDSRKGYSGVHWDDCLSRGRLLFGAANDDAHWRLPDFGQAWTMVRADEVTPEAVVEGLESGAFYASTGAVLEDVT